MTVNRGISVQEQLPPVDTIVALGGGVNALGYPTFSTIQRLETAIELYNNKRASHIVFSGKWSRNLKEAPRLTEAEAMKLYAIEQGVPDADVTIETRSTETVGNAYYCKVDIIEPRAYKNIILVTSPSHMPRSRWIFEHVLGNDYNVEPVCTNEPLRQEIIEHAGYLAIKGVLNDIKPGDHVAIASALPYLQATNHVGSTTAF